jgi:hypothetical protein
MSFGRGAYVRVGSSTGADWMSTWNTYAERCTEINDTSEKTDGTQ